MTDFNWDDKEEKTGMREACGIINDQINQMLKGKDIGQLKKIED